MNGPGSIPGSEAEAPTLVRRYVERVLPPGGRLPRRVRIRQTGQMWRKPGGRRLPFTSVEEFAVEEVAFSWRARFPVLPLVSMSVLDGYAGGEGRLEARLFGVPFIRVGGPETAEGEAIRYLSELPWVPHAVVGGVRIPALGEGRWELPDGPFTYWRGTITSLELGFEEVASS